MVENYVGGLVPPESMEATNQGAIDQVVSGILGFFFIGKFFALFSFLFGLSFFIQMDNASKKSSNFGGRFLWRLVVLFIIGYAHHLFYRGDILTIYALLGVLIIPFYKLDNKWVLIISIMIFAGFFRFIIYALFGSDSLFSDANLSPDNPAAATYFQTLKDGSILDVFKSNATEGQLMKMDFQLGIFGRGYLTFGFFLLGLLAGKIGIFNNLASFKKQLRRFLIRLCIGLVSIIAIVAVIVVLFYSSQNGQQQQQPDMESWAAMAGLTVFDIFNVLLTLILLSAFCLLFLKTKGQRFFLIFTSYGRMALSNYFLQSVIGTFILYGWGLGYLGELRNIFTFLIGLGIIAIQIAFSNFWLKHFQYGPLEWLWRSLTYFKKVPFRKS